MAIFVSFHYDQDVSRVQQVLRMGAIEGQEIVSAQRWESVKRQGPAAVERWIDEQMRYKTAVLVLVGNQTAVRPWVRYEIEKAWNDGRSLVGVRIHGLKGFDGSVDRPGPNPFSAVSLGNGLALDAYVTLHDPTGTDSKSTYDTIKRNLAHWVASATRRA